MKAIRCLQFGLPDTLTFVDIECPAINENQVLIAVKACGVNFPDTLIIQNKYQFKPTLPFSPGGEVAGVAIEIGSNVTHIKKGDRVLALCGWGGFAEQVAVDANSVFPIPSTIGFLSAATTLYSYGTSYHALKDRAQLIKGETVLILGAAGGVGLAAIELAKLMGATVIAAASSTDKLQACKATGADFLINYTTEDVKERVKFFTGNKGVDVVYDPVGGKYAEPALRSMAWKGRYLVVGFASGEIPQLPFNIALLKGCAIVGVFWGSFANNEKAHNLQNLQEIVRWIKDGSIKQHIHHIYPLEATAQALNDLMNRKVIGKAIIKVGDWQEELPINREQTKTQSIIENKKTHSTLTSFKNKEALAQKIGHSLGTTNWLTVTQEMINGFANTTLDFQWVHIDIEKAKAFLPGGKTIAHGYLTLSLASQFLYQLIHIEQVNSFLNYGINKARFISPVAVGSNIRMHASIANVETQPNTSVKLFLNCTIEIEGQEKPAYVAEIISLIY